MRTVHKRQRLSTYYYILDDCVIISNEKPFAVFYVVMSDSSLHQCQGLPTVA